MTDQVASEATLQNLSPGELGILASTLDSVAHVGDDAATDTLDRVIFAEGISDADSFPLAYYIVHDRQRDLI